MVEEANEDLARVRVMLVHALEVVYNQDSYLLDHGVNERSLVGRVAVALAPALEASLPGLSVDIEYNRNTPNRDALGILHKYLIGVGAGGTTPRYPDLIVHRRGVAGEMGGNLLVLEAKRGEVGTDDLADHAKLVAWCREFGYQAGVRLEFSRDQPRWAWVSKENKPDRLVRAGPALAKNRIHC